MARVLIGYSCCPLTREAFRAQGHDAWTCDLLPARDGSENHLQMDVWQAIAMGWDFGVFHPMCTYLTTSGAWALMDADFERYPVHGYHQKPNPEKLYGAARREAQAADLDNFRRLLELPFAYAIENPAVSAINTAIRPPDQTLHPYELGDDASKNTGLWLSRGVPKLMTLPLRDQAPGRLVEHPKGSGKPVLRWANQTDSGQNKLPPGPDRWLKRSETYPGIAKAMGCTWGRWLNEKFGQDAVAAKGGA